MRELVGSNITDDPRQCREDRVLHRAGSAELVVAGSGDVDDAGADRPGRRHRQCLGQLGRSDDAVVADVALLGRVRRPVGADVVGAGMGEVGLGHLPVAS